MSEAELNRLWKVFDVDIKRALPKATIAVMLRASGRLLLKDQMDALLKRFPDPMNCAQFIEAMNEGVSGEPKEKNLLTALQAFDVKEQNDLSRLEIMQMLTTMNEKITKEDLELLMEGCKFDGGDRANIDDFFKHLTRPLKTIAHKSVTVKGAAGGGGGGGGAAEADPFA
jgi:Ca2+-binding EF-hand superfamily protein